MLDFDASRDGVTRPSEAAMRNEDEALVQLALELLQPDDREVILMRQHEERSFAAIAARIHIDEGAARIRFHRELPRLAKRVEDLDMGRVGEAVEG